MESKVALSKCSLRSVILPHASVDVGMQMKITRALGSLYKPTSCYLTDNSPVDNIDDLYVYPDDDNNLIVEKTQRKKSLDIKAASSSKTVVLPGMVEKFSVSVMKYWCQRYQLFSKFDDGIKLDEEGWYSVTPEVLAKHHAERTGNSVIVDGFAGMGGNAIQFAMKSKHVIAIDINPRKIEYARQNAKIYGVADRIDFIVGDFFQLAQSIKADVVFLSPPWGGPDYAKVEKYDIFTMLKPQDGSSLFRAAQSIAPKIIMFLPKNVDIDQLTQLSLLSHHAFSLEVEENYINDSLKTITAYYSMIDQ